YLIDHILDFNLLYIFLSEVSEEYSSEYGRRYSQQLLRHFQFLFFNHQSHIARFIRRREFRGIDNRSSFDGIVALNTDDVDAELNHDFIVCDVYLKANIHFFLRILFDFLRGRISCREDTIDWKNGIVRVMGRLGT
ncbi:hypothetical protein PENTCL1PPCAC_9606, partial [Pristionchus entomophagus]